MHDPELIIRTGGEQRLSNFLLWESAYSELYFSDKMWPDFDREELERALDDYAHASTGTGAGRDCRSPRRPERRRPPDRRRRQQRRRGGTAARVLIALPWVAIAIAVVFYGGTPAFALLVFGLGWSRCTSSTGCWRR